MSVHNPTGTQVLNPQIEDAPVPEGAGVQYKDVRRESRVYKEEAKLVVKLRT